MSVYLVCNFFLLQYVYMCAGMHVRPEVDLGEEFSSFTIWVLRLNSIHQAWQQVTLHAEPACWH